MYAICKAWLGDLRRAPLIKNASPLPALQHFGGHQSSGHLRECSPHLPEGPSHSLPLSYSLILRTATALSIVLLTPINHFVFTPCAICALKQNLINYVPQKLSQWIFIFFAGDHRPFRGVAQDFCWRHNGIVFAKLVVACSLQIVPVLRPPMRVLSVREMEWEWNGAGGLSRGSVDLWLLRTPWMKTLGKPINTHGQPCPPYPLLVQL